MLATDGFDIGDASGIRFYDLVFPEEEVEGYKYVNFAGFFWKVKNELQRVYNSDFRKHQMFNELIQELFKNEIEYKFLEQANVIHSTIMKWWN